MTQRHDNIIKVWMNLNMYVYNFIHHIFPQLYGDLRLTCDYFDDIQNHTTCYSLHVTCGNIELQVIFNFLKLINKTNLI
jgi:hypothetical protein